MQIPDPDVLRRTYTEQIQPHVAEPILTVGFLSPAGLMGTYTKEAVALGALRMISPLASRGMRRKKAASHAVNDVTLLVAVGATTVSCFPFPTDRSPFAVHQAPTVWRRADMRVTADEPGRASRGVHIDLATGEHLDFEVAKGAKGWAGWSDEMLARLLDPVRA